ncbi:unnamed protein product, partial [Mesorhabditis spiculigera]
MGRVPITIQDDVRQFLWIARKLRANAILPNQLKGLEFWGQYARENKIDRTEQALQTRYRRIVANLYTYPLSAEDMLLLYKKLALPIDPFDVQPMLEEKFKCKIDLRSRDFTIRSYTFNDEESGGPGTPRGDAGGRGRRKSIRVAPNATRRAANEEGEARDTSFNLTAELDEKLATLDVHSSPARTAIAAHREEIKKQGATHSSRVFELKRLRAPISVQLSPGSPVSSRSSVDARATRSGRPFTLDQPCTSKASAAVEKQMMETRMRARKLSTSPRLRQSPRHRRAWISDSDEQVSPPPKKRGKTNTPVTTPAPSSAKTKNRAPPSPEPIDAHGDVIPDEPVQEWTIEAERASTRELLDQHCGGSVGIRDAIEQQIFEASAGEQQSYIQHKESILQLLKKNKAVRAALKPDSQLTSPPILYQPKPLMKHCVKEWHKRFGRDTRMNQIAVTHKKIWVGHQYMATLELRKYVWDQLSAAEQRAYNFSGNSDAYKEAIEKAGDQIRYQLKRLFFPDGMVKPK